MGPTARPGSGSRSGRRGSVHQLVVDTRAGDGALVDVRGVDIRHPSLLALLRPHPGQRGPDTARANQPRPGTGALLVLIGLARRWSGGRRSSSVTCSAPLWSRGRQRRVRSGRRSFRRPWAPPRWAFDPVLPLVVSRSEVPCVSWGIIRAMSRALSPSWSNRCALSWTASAELPPSSR